MLAAVLCLVVQGCGTSRTLPTTLATAQPATPIEAAATATPLSQTAGQTPVAAKTTAPTVTPSPVPPPEPPPSPTPTDTSLATAGAPAPVAIREFSASPSYIEAGNPVTLTWQASGEWATLYRSDEQGRLIEPSLAVSLTGTLVVTTSLTVLNQADFFLFAGAGNIYERSQLSVPIGCPNEWFFSDPPASCPQPAQVTAAAAQHFERGLLLWLQASGEERPFDEVYALYDDTALPRWQTMVDNWESGMPETDPEIVPPSGLFQPVRGFGKIWRERSGVRERLGWATDEEFQMENGVLQCASGKYASCYVTGPEGVVYVLYANGGEWAPWTGTSSEP